MCTHCLSARRPMEHEKLLCKDFKQTAAPSLASYRGELLSFVQLIAIARDSGLSQLRLVFRDIAEFLFPAFLELLIIKISAS